MQLRGSVSFMIRYWPQICSRIRPRHADTPHGPKTLEDPSSIRDIYSLRLCSSAKRVKKEPESAFKSEPTPLGPKKNTGSNRDKHAVATSPSNSTDSHEDFCHHCNTRYALFYAIFAF
jgi:hypothetical protein